MLTWTAGFKSAQRRPREGGDPYNNLFQLDKWIPAFAGMTLRKGGKRPRTPQRKYPGNQVPEKPKALSGIVTNSGQCILRSRIAARGFRDDGGGARRHFMPQRQRDEGASPKPPSTPRGLPRSARRACRSR